VIVVSSLVVRALLLLRPAIAAVAVHCDSDVLAGRGDRRAAKSELVERRERGAGPEDPRAGAPAAREH
jgi:hypothetical protein